MKEKEYLPEGISEAEFVEIVRQVSLNPSYKFRFACNDQADLLQQAYVIAITFLVEGKFKPRGEKPMRQQLANFLRVRIYKRLINFRRDKCCKYPIVSETDQARFNLAYPLKINSMGLANSEMFAGEANLPADVARKEITDRIISKMRKKIRILYDKFLSGEALEDEEWKRLRRSIKRILPGEAQEYIDG